MHNELIWIFLFELTYFFTQGIFFNILSNAVNYFFDWLISETNEGIKFVI